MKRMSFGIVMALVTFALGVAAASWFIPHPSSSTPTRKAAAPSWVTEELWGFSISVPPGMRRRDMRGTDSSIREYRDSSLLLQVTYGMTGDLPFDLMESKQPDYREEVVVIHGRKARWCTFRDAGLFGGKGNLYVAEMYFIEPGDRPRPIFFVACDSQAGLEIAKQIFRTVEFE
jgi:hypothetical protein